MERLHGSFIAKHPPSRAAPYGKPRSGMASAFRSTASSRSTRRARRARAPRRRRRVAVEFKEMLFHDPWTADPLRSQAPRCADGSSSTSCASGSGPTTSGRTTAASASNRTPTPSRSISPATCRPPPRRGPLRRHQLDGPPPASPAGGPSSRAGPPRASACSPPQSPTSCGGPRSSSSPPWSTVIRSTAAFGRVTLLGDAGHPTYRRGPNGAARAMIDARVLARCLDATDDTARR